MNLILRLLPSLLAQLIVICLGWPLLISGLGQGSHYVLAGWWASLLGLVVLIMGLLVPAIGLVVGLLASLFFRVPAETPVSVDAIGDLTVRGGLLYSVAYIATGFAMWQFAPMTPNSNASYGTGFLVVSVGVAFGFGFFASMVTGRVIARRGLPELT